MEETSNESNKEVEDLTVCSVPALHQPYPWLMLCDGKEKKQQIFYSITEDRFHIRFIDAFHKNKLMFCLNYKKWVIYQDDFTKECFLLNVSTMEKLPLPPINDLDDYPFIVLSSPIMDSACRILLFDLFPHRFLSCNLGDAKFIDRQVTFEGGIDFFFNGAVNLDGKLYVLGDDYKLATADYSDPHLVLKTIIKGQPLLKLLPIHDGMKTYLLESCGEILFVYTRSRDFELTDLKIFRADFSINKWVRVKGVGDRAIFLDTDHCYSSPASRFGLRGNCVYFVNQCGRNLFVFDLDDKSISMSLPCPKAKGDSFLFWMSITDE